MFFKSKYIIEISKPKEEILNDIEKNLYKKFFDWDKIFTGKVSEDSFDIRFFHNKMSPYFKGEFVGKNNTENIKLIVCYGIFSKLSILVAGLFSLIFVVILIQNGSYLWIAPIIFYALIIVSGSVRFNTAKDDFFKYLRKFDSLSEIIIVK